MLSVEVQPQLELMWEARLWPEVLNVDRVLPSVEDEAQHGVCQLSMPLIFALEKRPNRILDDMQFQRFVEGEESWVSSQQLKELLDASEVILTIVIYMACATGNHDEPFHGFPNHVYILHRDSVVKR